MAKYIDADIFRAKITDLCFNANFYQQKAMEESNREEFVSSGGEIFAYATVLSLIDSLQQEQPKEICSKCIHHGKDDDYCYNPHSGMQSKINENGIYECTGFCEQEQREGIINTLLRIREGFEKRLQTWWKRYGADKLHCWTYWAEA